MRQKIIIKIVKILYLFLVSSFYSSADQKMDTIRMKLDNFAEFSEILFVVDSLRLQDTIHFGLMSNRPGVSLWLWETSKPLNLMDTSKISSAFVNDSLVVHMPANFSSLVDHMNQIARFYRANRGRSNLAKPIFVIMTPEKLTTTERSNYGAVLHEFQLDSNLFFLHHHGADNSDLSVWEMYSLGNNTIFQEVDFIDDTLLGAFLQSAKRRTNFHLHEISCTAQNDHDYPLESEFKLVNGTMKMVGGLAVEIYHDLEFALNFTSKVVQGEGWMDKNLNGTWTGMGRQVYQGEVDISISQSIFLTERSADFLFLHPTHSGMVKAFFRQPRSSYFRNIYKHAFGGGVWIVSLLFWLIAALVIKIIFKITTIFTPSEPPSPNDEELSRNFVLWAIGTICQQGWYQDPQKRPVRIVFLSCSFCALITCIAFSGGLVSTLSTEVEPIQNLNDLLSGRFILMTDFYVPFIDDILEHAISSSKEMEPFWPTRDQWASAVGSEAINSIMSSRSAFLTLPDGFMSVFRRFNGTDHQFCESLSSLRVAKEPHRTGMFIRKGSPYKEIFNQKIIATFEGGLNFRHRKHYVQSTTAQCIPKNVNYREGLDLRDVFSAFVILFSGFCLCIILVVIECIQARLIRQKKYADIIIN